MKFAVIVRVLFIWTQILFIGDKAFSQVTKEFIAPDGKLTTDSTNAQAVLLIEKLNDTAYQVHQYNMKHILLAQGIFKDEQLTVSNGEFIYYKVEPASIRFLYHYDAQKIDTIRTPAKLYAASRGNLINGVKYGIWTDFFSDGSPQYITNLRADTANGLTKIFYQLPEFHLHDDKNNDLNLVANKVNNLVSIQGNYVNGKREGAWYSLSAKGDTIGVDYYEHDKGVKGVDYLSEKRFRTHIKPGYPDYDLDDLLNRKLSTRNADYNDGSLKIRFTLSKEGKLQEPLVENLNDNVQFYNTVIAELLSFRNWKPAYLDENAVQSEVEISIHYINKAGEQHQFTVDSGIGYIVPGYKGY